MKVSEVLVVMVVWVFERPKKKNGSKRLKVPRRKAKAILRPCRFAAGKKHTFS